MMALREKPLISVVIPTFNRGESLKRAVQSVVDQSYTRWELILQDDGSDDNWRAWVLEHICKGFDGCNLLYEYRPHKGVSAARNFGVNRARGEWIAFLDSDDEWLPDKLERQWQWSDENPEQLLIHGEELWIRNGIRVTQKKKHKKGGGRQFIPSIARCCIGPSTTLIKKSFFQELKGFREDFPVCEDYELWLRVTSQVDIGFITEPLIYKYGGHKDQLSTKFKAMDYWRLQALWPFFNSPKITRNEQIEVKAQLINYYNILQSGYVKYQKHNQLLDLRQLFLTQFSEAQILEF